MSIIAIRWAYSRPISNPVAKNVLVFLCSHDFPGNTSCFKLSQICGATSYKERAVRDALNELCKQGYIKKEARFGEDGRKLSNYYTYLVPQSYIDEFCAAYELSTPHRQEMPVPPAPDAGTPRRHVPDNKEQCLKNNTKKSFCASRSEKPKAPKPKGKPPMTRSTMKAENEDVHEWEKRRRKQEPRCTLQFFGPGHPDWERNFGASANG